MPIPVDPVALRAHRVDAAVADLGTAVAVFADPASDAGQELVAAETAAFPEAPDIFPADDPTFTMLGIVIDGIVHHVMRLSITTTATAVQAPFFVRDLVASEQGLTLSEGLRFYTALGIDLARTVSVETNSRLGTKDDALVSTADVAYLAVFDAMMRADSTAVFAHLNQAARKSFARVGLSAQPFMGDESIRTPGALPGSFDDDYSPVCLPVCEENLLVFEAIVSLMPPIDWASDRPSWWTDRSAEVVLQSRMAGRSVPS